MDSFERMVKIFKGEELDEPEALPIREGYIAFPLDMKDGREVYENLGIEFGRKSSPLYIEAKLPEGWRIEVNEFNPVFWSYLINKEGKKVARIFHKFTIYGQDTFIILKEE